MTHTIFQELLLTPFSGHEILGFEILSSDKHFCHEEIPERFRPVIVQYKDLKSCSGDFYSPESDQPTAQDHAVLVLLPNPVGFFISNCSWEMFCTTVVPISKGHLGGDSP